MAADNDLVQTFLVIVAIIVLVPFLMMIFAWPMMGMWGGGQVWSGSGATWLWLLIWLTSLLILFWGGYLLYRVSSRFGGKERDTALEELRLTYAHGEISNEEFEERRKRLQREV